MLTCLYLPHAARSHLLLPKPPFFVTMKFVNMLCFHSFSEEIHYNILFFFFLHSFKWFLLDIPITVYPQTLTLTPCPGSVLGVARSEHCGMLLRAAWSMWMRPGETQLGRGAMPWTLVRCFLSAKRFSAFNLWIIHYVVHFLFVATNERGPGGMRLITGTLEDWDRVRRQVPWAGPPSPCTREVLQLIVLILACMYAVNVA